MHDGAIFYRSARAGGRFADPEAIPAPEGPANYNSPHVVCGARGTVHVVFERDFTKQSRKAWYAVRREGRWSDPVLAIQAPASDRRVNYPRLAVAGSTAFVGAFVLGGSIIVRLDEVLATPRVTATTPTPLWAAHPLLDKSGGLSIVGRHGSRGHKLQRYSRDLEPLGDPLHLSHGTPTKTGEPTAAIIDPAGVVHVAGSTGSGKRVLWYTTNERASAGKPVILGPKLADEVHEYSYPVLLRDARGRIYVSYRRDPSGDGRITILESTGERFEQPVIVAPQVERRLRWNPHLAAAPAGGAYVAWDAGGRMYIRAMGEAAVKGRSDQQGALP
jgi:hypothetical protein